VTEIATVAGYDTVGDRFLLDIRRVAAATEGVPA
jgi:hypothetical protein